MHRYLGLWLLCPLVVFANPHGPNVVHGQAEFNASGQNLNVKTSQNAIIEWQGFSIAKNEKTAFLQPSARSAVLNRVVSAEPSKIFGALQSNGKVYLVNQNGVFVGSSGHLQVAAFVGSTFDVMNEDFLKGGDLLFQGTSPFAFVNEGKIEALDGDVVLIGGIVKNTGEILAPGGFCGIGCGQKVLLKPAGDERIYILAPWESAPEADAGIQQQGLIKSLSAEIKASANPYALAIQHEGVIDALGVKNEHGNVFLVAEGGNLQVAGKITAKKGELGGKVQLLGEKVSLEDTALIDASGKDGGGTVLIGGDYQGKNPLVLNAEQTYVAPKAKIQADALENGNGGKVIVWGNDATAFFGTISARGGEVAGDGGFVEVSGKYLDFKGFADRRAPYGQSGTLLLDTINIEIKSNAGVDSANVTSPGGGGTYTFTACAPSPAIIDNSLLVSNLTAGSVIINTSAAGGAGCLDAGTILVSDPVVWPVAPTAAAPTKLTLQADSKVTVNASLISQHTSAPAAINAIEITAPDVEIKSIGTAIIIETFAGDIQINATNSFLQDAANQAITMLTANSSQGSISISVSSGDFKMQSATVGVGTATISSNKNLTLSASGNMDLLATQGVVSAEVSANAALSTPMIVNAGGYLHLYSGAANLAAASLVNEVGPLDLTVGGEIDLKAGSTNFAYAAIVSGAQALSTGDLTIHSATDIKMTSGTANKTMATIGTGNPIIPAPGGDGKIDVHCSGSITMTGGANDTGYAGFVTAGSAANNDISITYTNALNNNMTILSQGGAVAQAFAGVKTISGGSITISGLGAIGVTGSTATNMGLIQVGPSGGNLSITGTGAADLHKFSVIENLFPTGTVTLQHGSLTLDASTGAASVLSKGNMGITTVAGGVKLDASGAAALISVQSSPNPGDMSITTTGGDLTLNANTDKAQILTDAGKIGTDIGGNIAINAIAQKAEIIPTGDGDIKATGHLTITSSGDDGQINTNGAGPFALKVDVGGNIQLFGGNGNALVGITSTPNSLLDVTAGGSLFLTSLQKIAAVVNVLGPANVFITGSIITQSGGVPGAFAGIGAAFNAGTVGNLVVNAADISLTAGTAASTLTFIGTGQPGAGNGGDGSITISLTGAGGITLNGGLNADSGALIGTFGALASVNDVIIHVNQPADIKLISNAPVGVMNSSAAITTEGFGANTTGGDITIDGAMRDLIMTSVSSDSPSLIGVGVAGGDMLVLAGEDLNIGSLSKIFNLAPAGKVTLVADNYNPTSPLVGVGEFNLGSGASLSTASGSSLFIYTALDTQNHVDGTMNASPLILPIIPFVNTPDAQWGIYYPNNPNAVTGTPYTIFYKDHGTPPTPPTPPTPSPGLVTAYSILVAGTKAQNLYTISLGESFDDWSTYSYRPVYVLKKIRIEFPDSGKWRLPVWEYSYFYTSHRNYQTLKLDQRL